jgi:hypothetical protein
MVETVYAHLDFHLEKLVWANSLLMNHKIEYMTQQDEKYDPKIMTKVISSPLLIVITATL